jgi:hypothetical protein
MLFFLTSVAGFGCRSDVETINVHSHLALVTLQNNPETKVFDGTIDVQLEMMDDAGVDLAIIMPPPSEETGGGYYDCHDAGFLSEIANCSNPERFGVMCGGGLLSNYILIAAETSSIVDEAYIDEFKAAARTLAETAGSRFVGFGELAGLHLCPADDEGGTIPVEGYMEGLPGQLELFKALVDVADEYDVPIDIHMEAVTSDNFPFPDLGVECSSNPDTLNENIRSGLVPLLQYARDNTDDPVIIIWSHAGWDLTSCRTAELQANLLAENSNLYVSLKYQPTNSSALTRLMDGQPPNVVLRAEWADVIETYPGQIMIGSDGFAYSSDDPRGATVPADFMRNIWAIESQLSPELFHRISYCTPARLFQRLNLGVRGCE